MNTGLLALTLYAFPFHEFNDQGQLIDVGALGVPLRFLVSVNMPVALQIQSAIALLAEYVARQEFVGRALREDAMDDSISQIDVAVREVDRLTLETVTDDLRLGWEESVGFVAQRAADVGIAFAVSYQRSAVTAAEALSRVSLARELYNDVELVRSAIDRTVAVVAGREFELKGHSVPEHVRTLIRQITSAANLSRYLAHLLRDSMVCGNGYLVIPDADPLNFYCLPPDTTTIDQGGRVVSRGNTYDPERVIHLLGLKQPNSSIGLSVLEPLMGELGKLRIFDEIERTVGSHEHKLSPNQVRWLRAKREQRMRIVSERDDRIDRMFAAALAQPLSKASSDLYLPGFDRY